MHEVSCRMGVKNKTKETTMRNASTFFLSLVVLAGAAAFLSACNTTAGAGKDVSEIGQTVTDTADKHK